MMDRQRLAPPLIILIVVLSGLMVSTPSAYAQSTNLPHFESDECPFDIPFETVVDCGYLIVPESRSDPDSRTIRLAVAVIRSANPNPEPDPVVYLEGGPGGAATEGINFWVTSPFLASRDFILMDQRGTGLSEPGLHCPEYDELSAEYFDDHLENDESLKLVTEASFACRDRLIAEGVDLSAYNSAESAADFDDLRQVLGYDEWNLYGISYGTRLALTIMRDHPEGVRSVILDSTVAVPVNTYEEGAAIAHRAFNELFEGCAQNADCSKAYPDFEADFYELVDKLNEDPVTVRIENPYLDEVQTVPIYGDDLHHVLFSALYRTDLIPFLPLMFERALRGDYRMLAAYIETDAALNADFDFSAGMYYSVQCHEELPFNDWDTTVEIGESFPELNGFLVNDADFTVCPEWGAGDTPDIESDPVISNIPTLVLGGEYDPITPPAWGQLTADSLTNVYFFEVAGSGHGVSTGDCGGDIALQFVKNPSHEPDVSCLHELTGPEFVTRMVVSPRVYKLLETLLIDYDLLQISIIVLSMLLFGSALSVWPVLRIIHRVRQRPEKPTRWVTLAGWLSTLLPAWNIAVVVGLVIVVISAVVQNETMLTFGTPFWSFPLYLMPVISILLTLALIVLHIPVWREGFWGMFGRIYFALITLTAFLFNIWLIFWGLISLPI